jgi:hypothetical protein
MLPDHCQWNHYRERVISYHYLVRWDNARSHLDFDVVIRLHAACLRADYNHLLIIIHRPFITMECSTPASTTSLAICTSAARANARILEECVLDIRVIVGWLRSSSDSCAD